MNYYELATKYGGKQEPDYSKLAQQFGGVGEESTAFQGDDSEKPGFAARVGADYESRQGKVREMVDRQTSGGVAEDIFNAPAMGALALGQGAGLLLDVAGQAVKSGYDTIMPEKGKKAISAGLAKIASTPVGQMGLKALQEGQEAYGEFREAYPDAALALEGALNIGAVGVGGKGVETAAVSRAKGAPGRLAKEYSQVVEEGIEKSIRPSVAGKRTFAQRQQYMNQAERAVDRIIENRASLRLTDEFGDVAQGLPQNLKQFSQAVHQTKGEIYKQYDELAQAAGQMGAKVDLRPIAKEIEAVIKSKPLQDNAPDVVEYVKKRAAAFSKRGEYTTSEAQEALEIMNKSLEAFYKNPTYETASKATIDAAIANNMRRSLDAVIEKTTVPGYQALKRDYGALKAIERDVNRRALVDARKNAKGLIDFVDIFSGGQIVQGILSMNPALVGQGVAMNQIKRLYSRMSDPNRKVKQLFAKAEKVKKKMDK